MNFPNETAIQSRVEMLMSIVLNPTPSAMSFPPNSNSGKNSYFMRKNQHKQCMNKQASKQANKINKPTNKNGQRRNKQTQ
jgi:hypothetical protein